MQVPNFSPYISHLHLTLNNVVQVTGVNHIHPHQAPGHCQMRSENCTAALSMNMVSRTADSLP